MWSFGLLLSCLIYNVIGYLTNAEIAAINPQVRIANARRLAEEVNATGVYKGLGIY